MADMSASTHRDTCLAILSKIFFRGNESQTVLNAPDIQRDPYTAGVLSIDKVKVYKFDLYSLALLCLIITSYFVKADFARYWMYDVSYI